MGTVSNIMSYFQDELYHQFQKSLEKGQDFFGETCRSPEAEENTPYQTATT